VAHPAGGAERLLVPGTDGAELELEPILVYEEASATLFVLWLERGADGLSHLLLAALTESAWMERVAVTREAMAIERPPTVVLNREPSRRTVVHLAWSAEEAGNTLSFYSPIVLFMGEYAGWNPIVELGRLDEHPAGGAEAAAAIPSALFQAGGVAEGVDLRSVVLAFASEATGHLLTARARALPLGLVAFADEARNHLIGVGSGWRRSGRELADEVAAHLEELEHEIHAGARAFLSRAARSFIVEHVETAVSNEELATALRRHLLEAGAPILSQEFETPPQTCGLIEVGPDDADQTQPAAHVVELCRVSDRVLPTVGEDAVAIHASRDGGLVLLTWREDGALRFRLSEGSGWSEPRSLEAGGDVDLLWQSIGR